MVAVNRDTGKIVNVITFDGKIYDLNDITFIKGQSQDIIQFKQEKFNVIYSYDANGDLTDVSIDITGENLGNGGVTIYVKTDPSELGWTLPDGTKVYYKNAFKDGTEVQPVFLGMQGKNYLYLLEPLYVDRPFYHVVEFKLAGEEYIFVEAHIYTKDELLNAAVVELGRGMSLKEARQAAQSVLNSYSQSSFSASSTPADVAAEVKAALQSKLTDDWSFTVTARFTTKQITVTVGEGEEQKEETRTIIDDIQISIILTEVVAAGETPETTTIDKTINVAADKFETTLTGEALTSTTASIRHRKTIRLWEPSLLQEFWNRSGTIFVNKTDGIVSGMTVKKRAYYFNLVFNDNHQAYLVEPEPITVLN